MSASKLALNLALTLAGVVAGANDVAAPTQAVDFTDRRAYALGTTANKADLFFSDTRTLSASTSENLDLAGVLADAFGATLSFVDVVAVIVEAAAGNTNDVVVGGATSAAWAAPFGDVTDKVNVKPGGLFVLAAGGDPAYPVTATTADILKVANSGAGTPVTYTIIIVGRSA